MSTLAAVTNPLGHLYGGRLPSVPERFLGRLGAGTKHRKARQKGAAGLPEAVGQATGMALGEHPAVALVGLAVVGLAGAVWGVARALRRPRQS